MDQTQVTTSPTTDSEDELIVAFIKSAGKSTEGIDLVQMIRQARDEGLLYVEYQAQRVVQVVLLRRLEPGCLVCMFRGGFHNRTNVLGPLRMMCEKYPTDTLGLTFTNDDWDYVSPEKLRNLLAALEEFYA